MAGSDFNPQWLFTNDPSDTRGRLFGKMLFEENGRTVNSKFFDFIKAKNFADTKGYECRDDDISAEIVEFVKDVAVYHKTIDPQVLGSLSGFRASDSAKEAELNVRIASQIDTSDAFSSEMLSEDLTRAATRALGRLRDVSDTLKKKYSKCYCFT